MTVTNLQVLQAQSVFLQAQITNQTNTISSTKSGSDQTVAGCNFNILKLQQQLDTVNSQIDAAQKG